MTKILTVSFHGTELYGFDLSGVVYVALKPLVEGMGLDWSSQHKRLRREPVLSEGMVMMTIPFGRGGPQQSVCLRLDLVPGWLFKVDSTRVAKRLRERVQLYQRECYGVLARNFLGESARLAQQANESESLRVRIVAEARQTFGERAAAQLWHKLELPLVPAMAMPLAQGDLFEWAATAPIQHAS
jgi:hypothetical protein